jgi:6-phosphogluconolactonase
MSEESHHVYADADTLARAAAAEVLRLAERSVAERGLFTLALAGGSTPKKLYGLLATDPAYRTLPWDKTHFFFGDERHVPPDHAESNYLMVKNSLLSTGLVPEQNVHRVRAELPDAHQAAADYDVELHRFFGEALRPNGYPQFDLILLGMGPDGHTASLFPDSQGLKETQRWCIANPVEKFKTDRITFTFPVLNAARAVYLLVAGADKADMIYEVLVAQRDRPVYPVQRVVPTDGIKVWMLDRAAAAKLPPELQTA